MSNKIELQKRKTFGIVSHPDAGKTTLTEKIAPLWWCDSGSWCRQIK